MGITETDLVLVRSLQNGVVDEQVFAEEAQFARHVGEEAADWTMRNITENSKHGRSQIFGRWP